MRRQASSANTQACSMTRRAFGASITDESSVPEPDTAPSRDYRSVRRHEKAKLLVPAGIRGLELDALGRQLLLHRHVVAHETARAHTHPEVVAGGRRGRG
jgi:hypothetical protein